MGGQSPHTNKLSKDLTKTNKHNLAKHIFVRLIHVVQYLIPIVTQNLDFRCRLNKPLRETLPNLKKLKNCIKYKIFNENARKIPGNVRNKEVDLHYQKRDRKTMTLSRSQEKRRDRRPKKLWRKSPN